MFRQPAGFRAICAAAESVEGPGSRDESQTGKTLLNCLSSSLDLISLLALVAGLLTLDPFSLVAGLSTLDPCLALDPGLSTLDPPTTATIRPIGWMKLRRE